MQEYIQFAKWSGSCVPFVFDVESEDSWLRSLEKGTPDEVIYYIATLCRNDKFRFRYYRYENREWSEIKNSEFPKEKALENLWDWQGGGIKYSRDTPKYIQDGIQESPDIFVRERLRFNPESYIFYTSLTARMWAHLESNADFWEFDDHFSDQAAKEHAINYFNKYSVK